LCSDFHCGSATGLTSTPRNDLQTELLRRYKHALKWLGPVDTVVLNGDPVDGKDPKSRDVDEEDMLVQAEDAARLIVMQKPASEVVLVTGTKYHCAWHTQEFERHIKKCLQYWSLKTLNRELKVTIARKFKVVVNNWFRAEFRHKVGGSAIPHGRATAPLRNQMWNVMNASYNDAKPPHLIVFGHRHYYVAGETAWGDVVVLPGWQALGSVYGDEECDGHVDLGLVRLTIEATESRGWSRDKILFPAGVVSRTEQR
jgi:hypothetical protein